MKGFSRRFVLKQRYKVTRNWSILRIELSVLSTYFCCCCDTMILSKRTSLNMALSTSFLYYDFQLKTPPNILGMFATFVERAIIAHIPCLLS